MINDQKRSQQIPGPVAKAEAPATPTNPFAAMFKSPEKTFTDIVVDAFNAEYLRVCIVDAFDPQKQEVSHEDRIETWAINLYTSTNFMTFFTEASLQKTTEDIFSNEIVRDFVLNIVERVTMMTRSQGSLQLERELSTVVSAVIQAKPDPGKSVIPEQITNSIKIDESLLRQLVNDNIYLFVLYVLLMDFNRVAFFEKLLRVKENVDAQRQKK